MILQSIKFESERTAKVLVVNENDDVSQIISPLKLTRPKALLVINGQAANFHFAVQSKLFDLFYELALIAVREKMMIITGGTDAGVFKIFGQALKKCGGASAPCIGVSITGYHHLGGARLEQNHTHFVLVESQNWGDATPVMYQLVDLLVSEKPSVTVVAGGGEFTRTEIEANVACGREIILISGCGGYTDLVLRNSSDDAITDLALNMKTYDRVSTFDIDDSPPNFINLIMQKLEIL